MKPLAIRIDEFCRIMGVGRTKTYQLIAQNELKIIKIGRRTLITVASVEALLTRVRPEDE